jgi:hypothetical protein
MLEGTRFRLVGLIEWVIAAGCVCGVVMCGAIVAAEFRSVRPIVPVIAGAADARVISAANVRPGAVSVPELVLPDGRRLTVGASASLVDAFAPAQSGPTVYERAEQGQRESRTYRYAGMEFVVVTAADRVIAIFR